MQKYFKPLIVTSIVLIYLIIIAGAVVRMTGSGMGCPDWPKCFGYYIPPIQEAQLLWKSNHEYQKGIIIIVNEALRIAPNDFISGQAYNPNNWQPYTEHDYAIFNAWHTWIEYINRLVTVLSGFPILLMTVFSFGFWKKNKQLTIFAVLTVAAMLFQAYLGKTVVDSNLLPLKITIHLVMAFVILAILIYMLFLLNSKHQNILVNTNFKKLLFFAVVLSLIQIIMGTQVRQYVDEQVKFFGDGVNEQWLKNPTLLFYTHRSFSILVLLVNSWLLYLNKKLGYGITLLNIILLFIIMEALTGIIMYYFDFPFLSQPLHLLLAALLFGVQFYVVLGLFIKKRTILNS